MQLVRGIIVGDDFDKIIVQAKPEEIKAFGQPGDEVAMAPVGPGADRNSWSDILAHGQVYDRTGRPIAIIERLYQSPQDLEESGERRTGLLGFRVKQERFTIIARGGVIL